MRGLLASVLAERSGVRGAGFDGGLGGGVGQGEHRMSVLAGVAAELLRTQFAGAPALVEGVLEDVDRATGVIESLKDVHIHPPLVVCTWAVSEPNHLVAGSTIFCMSSFMFEGQRIAYTQFGGVPPR